MRFLKFREEEHITWAGLAGVTSTDQRQNRLKRQKCWEGTDGLVRGQGGNKGKMKAIPSSITER